jgi:DNA invertase Pin-like site-specific DNA recombinase
VASKQFLIGYARVSTEDQELRLQLAALVDAGVNPSRIFSEKASGTRGTKRESLAAALRACRRGDALVVWKLDRLGRSLEELIATVRLLESKGVNLRILTGIQVDTTTAAGKLIFHIFAALAEFEAELSRERTMAGLAAAAREGRRGGRQRVLVGEKVDEAIALLREGKDPRDVAKAVGVSKSLIYQRMRGEWAGKLAEGTAK